MKTEGFAVIEFPEPPAGLARTQVSNRNHGRHCRGAFAATVLALLAPCAGAQALNECVAEPDNVRRLACYDRLFREGQVNSASRPTPLPAAGKPPSNGNEQAEKPPPSPLTSRFWELGPEDKRGTFTVRTYLPNFVLPLHYTTHINRDPGSPTHPASGRDSNYRPIEAKLQISLRAKVAEGLLLPDADLWFAYTQRSLWQVWNPQDSRPFRSTDYQPEAIYVIPVPRPFGALPGGWQWRLAQLGIAHQSNGQSDPLSRSWNRVYLGAVVERGDFGLQVRANRRFAESPAHDDNPDLTRYIGTTEIAATWLPGESTAALTWRTDLKSASRGSLQLDWTYPVNRHQPAGLRWYLQLFSGYGETLIDYNVRQTSVGLGITLFQF